MFKNEEDAKDIRRWKELLNNGGHLHLHAQDLPFDILIRPPETVTRPHESKWKQIKRNYVRLLRIFAGLLPLPLISALAWSLGAAQSLFRFKSNASPEDLYVRQSNWFRLLSYPETHLPTREQLQRIAEEANIHDLRLQFLKPAGYHFSGGH